MFSLVHYQNVTLKEAEEGLLQVISFLEHHPSVASNHIQTLWQVMQKLNLYQVKDGQEETEINSRLKVNGEQEDLSEEMDFKILSSNVPSPGISLTSEAMDGGADPDIMSNDSANNIVIERKEGWSPDNMKQNVDESPDSVDPLPKRDIDTALPCEMCSKTSDSAHLSQLNSPIDATQNTCGLCGRELYNTDTKNFPCRNCNESFQSYDHLKHHRTCCELLGKHGSLAKGLPKGLAIRKSTVKACSIKWGIFSTVLMTVGTRWGPYIDNGAHNITESGCDGKMEMPRVTSSEWMRYVRSTDYHDKQNITVVEEKDGPLYTAIQDIPANCELLISPADHIFDFAPKPAFKKYKCDLCVGDNMRFSEEKDFTRHKLLHSIPSALSGAVTKKHALTHICVTCGKTFITAQRLEQHSAVHSDRRPHICYTCGKSFSRNSSLYIHKASHKTDIAYTCETCGVSFNTTYKLQKHKKIHEEKQFVCPVCGKAFTRLDGLQKHSRSHTGERPFHCDVCGHDFADKSNYVKHKRNHDQVKIVNL